MQNTRYTDKTSLRPNTASSWTGTLWIGTSALLVVAVGLFVAAHILFSPLQNMGWTRYVIPGSNRDTQVTDLVTDHQDRIWVGTSLGLYVLGADHQWTRPLSKPVTSLAIDRQGRVWAGWLAFRTQSDSGAIVGVTDVELDIFEPDGRPTVYASALAFHADIRRILALAIDGAGRPWLVVQRGEPVRMELGRLESNGNWVSVLPELSPSPATNSVVVDREDRVWVSGYRLTAILPDDRTVVYDVTNSGLPENNVLALALDAQDRLWVKTLAGISLLDPSGRWTRQVTFPVNAPLREAGGVMAVDDQGRLWFAPRAGQIGSPGGGLALLDASGEWTTYTPSNSGLAASSVNQLALDRHGQVWSAAKDEHWQRHTSVFQFLFPPERAAGLEPVLSVLDMGASLSPALLRTVAAVTGTLGTLLPLAMLALAGGCLVLRFRSDAPAESGTAARWRTLWLSPAFLDGAWPALAFFAIGWMILNTSASGDIGGLALDILALPGLVVVKWLLAGPLKLDVQVTYLLSLGLASLPYSLLGMLLGSGRSKQAIRMAVLIGLSILVPCLIFMLLVWGLSRSGP